MYAMKEVRRAFVSAMFGIVKKLFDEYGDYDAADDFDVCGNPMEIYYQYTLAGHVFRIRNAEYPEGGDGIDVSIFYNGNVEITIYCSYEKTKVSLIVFDKEDDIDSTVRQALEVIELLLDNIVKGYTVYHLHRYLSYCDGNYTWKDALSDYKAFCFG